MKLPPIDLRLLGAYGVAAIGLVAICLIWVYPEEALGLVPAPALRLIPVDARPLTYQETFRGCGDGYVQGYEASDGARVAATNMSEPGQADWLAELGLLNGDDSSLVFRHTLTDASGGTRGERLLAKVVDPESGDLRYVLCVVGNDDPLHVIGPTERHVLDVERIERGDRTLIRNRPLRAAPN